LAGEIKNREVQKTSLVEQKKKKRGGEEWGGGLGKRQRKKKMTDGEKQERGGPTSIKKGKKPTPKKRPGGKKGVTRGAKDVWGKRWGETLPCGQKMGKDRFDPEGDERREGGAATGKNVKRRGNQR